MCVFFVFFPQKTKKAKLTYLHLLFQHVKTFEFFLNPDVVSEVHEQFEKFDLIGSGWDIIETISF